MAANSHGGHRPNAGRPVQTRGRLVRVLISQMTSTEFRATRQSLGLTQTELADRLGMTQPMVSRIERGERQPTVQQGAAIMLLRELLTKGENS